MDQIIKATEKIYDLEERTYLFAKQTSSYCKQLPRTISSVEYVRQLIRSSGSVGANYIEANEALSKKDFLMRIKICRKEAKESAYWLRLLHETAETAGAASDTRGSELLAEAIELKKIFSAILNK